MSKLSANGRTELVRLEKETNVTDSESVDWQRDTVVLMSDGTIHAKYDVRFVASAFSAAQKHSYGWKKSGKVKPGVTAERFAEVYTSRGYTRK